jgi:hypothetical protein
MGRLFSQEKHSNSSRAAFGLGFDSGHVFPELALDIQKNSFKTLDFPELR